MATDMTGSGTPEEKLRWAFRMYDKDNSGDLLHNEQIKNEVYRFYRVKGDDRNNRNIV